MSSAKVKVGVKPLDFVGISNLATLVIAGLTANALLFPAPPVSLVSLNLDLISLNNAITAWVPVGNRGSHADYLDLKQKAQLMRNDLFTDAAYVQTVIDFIFPYAAQAAAIVSAGYSVKNLPMPQGLLGQPQNLHQFSSNAIDVHTPFIKWRKPLALLSPNNVKSYEIFRSLMNILPLTSIASVTSTKFLDTDVTIRGTTQFYWIRGLNDAGLGAPTASIQVDIPL